MWRVISKRHTAKIMMERESGVLCCRCRGSRWEHPFWCQQRYLPALQMTLWSTSSTGAAMPHTAHPARMLSRKPLAQGPFSGGTRNMLLSACAHMRAQPLLGACIDKLKRPVIESLAPLARTPLVQ